MKAFELYCARNSLWKNVVLVALLLQTTAFSQTPRSTECLEADIAITADLSSSVSQDAKFIWSAVSILPSTYEMGENKVRFGLVRFNAHPTVVSSLSGDRTAFLKSIEDTRKTVAGGSTSIYEGLSKAYALFTEKPRSGLNHRFVILITDGISTDDHTAGDELDLARSIKDQGIPIIVVQTPAPERFEEENEEEMDWDAKPPVPVKKQFFNKIGITRSEWNAYRAHLKALATNGLFFEQSYETLEEFFRTLILPCS